MNRLARLKEVLWIISMFGLVAIVVRVISGLGASTDLSDAMPWGLWKILNVITGDALATGGFTMAATVYIFNLKKYKPLLRPAILIAFLGYGSSLFANLWDIGLPHAFYNPFFYWNHHSFLFVVFWCVILYFMVSVLELSPVIFEKFRAEKIVKWLHRVSIPVVITGVTLSTIHHTSLGSLFLVMPVRLHDLWFTNWVPVLFFFSAVGGGMMMVILVFLAHSYFFNKKENMPVLTDLAKGAAVVLCVYFIIRITDLLVHGNFTLLFSGQWESFAFMVEILVGIIIPVIIVAMPSMRNKTVGLLLASSSTILGLVLNRINVGILGLLRSSELTYFPTFLEISLSFGIIAAAALVFIYIVEKFHVFEESPDKLQAPEFYFKPTSHLITQIWSQVFMSDRTRISLIIVITIPLAVGAFYSNALQGFSVKRTPVEAPRGLNETRTLLEINGNSDDNFVIFDHKLHINKLREGKSCLTCHHLNLPKESLTSCYKCHSDMYLPASIFDHVLHEREHGGKWSCVECHDPALPKNLENSTPCYECHKEDMQIEPPPENARFNFYAPSYMDAIHGMCITCHEEQEKILNNPGMAECAHCHQDAWNVQFNIMTKEVVINKIQK